MDRTGVGVGVCLWLCTAVLFPSQGQNYVNIARDKTYNQSSIHVYQVSPSMAANGNTSGKYPGNCIHTLTADADPWWEVDLGRTYPVYNVTVWARDRYNRRLYPSTITVDGQTCAVVTSNTRRKKVTCSDVMYGQKVRISRQGLLNLCEVQIWDCGADWYGQQCNTACSASCNGTSCHRLTGRCSGCVAGRYGDQCTTPCSPGCQNTVCDQQTGQCSPCNTGYTGSQCSECLDNFYKPQGNNTCSNCTWTCHPETVCDKTSGYCPLCPPGRRGDRCDQNCSTGWYGQNCTQECGQCQNQDTLGSCDPVTGQCEAGCPAGWQAPLCQQECEDGSWGANCSKTCGQCKDGAVCDKVDGQCPLCEPGWMPPLCDTQCPDGFYGEGCNQTCGNCRVSSECHHVTGRCTGQCADGFTGSHCTVECPDGYYGEGCKQKCGNCRDISECRHDTGQCTGQCAVGFTGTHCTEECPDGYYGRGCNQKCGNCRVSSECLHDTGRCTGQCAEGFTGTHCTKECPDGFYGKGCEKTCGNCRDISECLHDTGRCTGQCAEGFTGSHCAEAVADQTPVVVGAVVSAVVVILIVVCVVVLVKRRTRHHGNQRQPERADSQRLSFAPVIASGGSGDNPDARPKARVKPVTKAAARPGPAQAGDSIYQNIPLQPQTSTSGSAPTAPDPSTRPDGTVREEPRPASETLTEDEELDALWSGQDSVYSNDPSRSCAIRLDQLLETVVEGVRKGKVAQEFSSMEGFKEFPVTNGKRQENHYKNRFNSILPYDRSRVVLEQVDGDDSSDYINASFVKGYKTAKAYIAAQGPRSNTQDDFWRMVWQEGVTDIVMLTNLKEGNKPKCHEYWPAKGSSLNTGHMEVVGLEEEERAHYVIRTFTLGQLRGQEKRQVRQYHYVKWMDHEVPTTTPLVDFWRYIRARAPRTPTAPPLLVHCSAGVGRTGTYIALDILMDQSQEDDTISLYTTVSNLRDYRCHMVQNKGQYEFLHEAVLEAYMSGDTRLDTSSFDRIFPSTIRHDQPQPRIDAEFKRLCQMRTCLTHPSHTLASQEENQAKNRNPDALPDDKHLLYITERTIGRNQYINAVCMPTFLSARGSIVTQLPLADTVIDLWRLVDSWDVTTIVSLGQVKGHKESCQYWPELEEPTRAGAYTVTLKAKTSLGENLVSYALDMNKEPSQDKSREVRVLHYEAWTGEVADNVPDLLCLLDILHTSHKEPTKQPVIVQCLDGVARSGVVCALWDVISRMTYDGEADVYLAVRHVHTVRPEAITSVVQYRFLYEVVQQYTASQMIYVNT
ncbi:uncharacterized protein LOC143299916 isoform X2 [Babylonia areolata]|uniref:uncharacterized protein LOC143299916 isoform X2 n=1 Tax=Babylonia areolata TaxID=304850 RepID=UPI003FD3E81D